MAFWGQQTREFLGRSLEELSRSYGPVLKAAVRPWKDPFPDTRHSLMMAKLHNEKDLRLFMTGCDADIGGYSVANLGLDQEGKGRFWGNLDMTVPPKKEDSPKIVRSGYAGMRTKVQHTILGRRTWDTTDYKFLKVRVRNHIKTRSCFFVNISTDQWDPPKLWQHRLWLHPTYNWQEIIIPFTDFTLTVQGNLAKYPQQPVRDDISTVGLSLLGPHGGPFDISVDSFEAINILNEVNLLVHFVKSRSPQEQSHYRPPADDRLLVADVQAIAAAKQLQAQQQSAPR